MNILEPIFGKLYWQSVFIGNISCIDVPFVFVKVVSSSLETFERSIKALCLNCIVLLLLFVNINSWAVTLCYIFHIPVCIELHSNSQRIPNKESNIYIEDIIRHECTCTIMRGVITHTIRSLFPEVFILNWNFIGT